MSNVLKDIPEDIMSKAPAVRNRRSLKRSDFEDNNSDEMAKNQIDKSMRSLFNGDVVTDDERCDTNGEALCIHSPSTGCEYLGVPQSIQHILIISGGIAGLECTRILAIRGHNVSLHETSKMHKNCVIQHGTFPTDNTLFGQFSAYSVNNCEVDMKPIINCQSCLCFPFIFFRLKNCQ